MVLRILFSFGLGFLCGAYVDQNYYVPPVEDMIKKYKEELAKLMPERKDDSDKKD